MGSWYYAKKIPKRDQSDDSDESDASEPDSDVSSEDDNDLQDDGVDDDGDETEYFSFDEFIVHSKSVRRLRKALGLLPHRIPMHLKSSAVDTADAHRIMLAAADAEANRRGIRVIYTAHDRKTEVDFFRAIGKHIRQTRGYAGMIDTSPLFGNSNAGEWIESYGFAVHESQVYRNGNRNQKKHSFSDARTGIHLGHDGLMDALYTGKALAAYLLDFKRQEYDPRDYVFIPDPNIVIVDIDVEAADFANVKRYTQVRLSICTSLHWLQHPEAEWPNAFEILANNYNLKMWYGENTAPGYVNRPQDHEFHEVFEWWPRRREGGSTINLA